MANIGSFKKVGGEFQGEIVTLSVQTKNVRIVPEAVQAFEKGSYVAAQDCVMRELLTGPRRQ